MSNAPSTASFMRSRNSPRVMRPTLILGWGAYQKPLHRRVERCSGRPAGVVREEQYDLPESVGVELLQSRRTLQLQLGDVELVAAGQQAHQQQSSVAHREAWPRPDVREQVVGGVAEEV